ncbi:hypothetical protein F2B00_03315 [Streptomyces parvus]|uniref:hypothetical protein n=1 Tax=Streptomyces parvus TaxID=66428 RepID=UPI001238E814|nr:hypothetical protein [Streptomyces parvus]KAA6203662.1 hypothetical protein F2B00_03315 [Streptomyces parvus]GGS42023.1 hypothetical protein GCM10010221_46150 [Streptomyces parvus]
MHFRYDPDEWRPAQGHSRLRANTGRLKPGSILVWDRQPYRLIEVRERDHADWPQNYRDAWVKHGMPDPATWGYRPRVAVLRHDDQPQSKPLHLLCPDSTYWYVLPEHYWVCRTCQELPPCRHVHNEAVMERAAERMEKEMAIMPGVCHGCREPISSRQKSFAFPGPNLIRPDLGDDSAVFHTRNGCAGSMKAYDERWAAAEEGRRRYFYCEGTKTVHHDGTSECSTPDCLAKGNLADWVEHKLWIQHHPGSGPEVQGCWCLAAAAA